MMYNCDKIHLIESLTGGNVGGGWGGAIPGGGIIAKKTK